jgi:CheY-like chemotaxis protein
MAPKLLVIDDDRSTALIVARIAETTGFSVKTISNPFEALEAFLEFDPDVVFLDMIMPEKDGIDVLQEILLAGAPERIILSSAFGRSYLFQAKELAEFYDKNNVIVLDKPFRREELVDALQGPNRA